MSCFCFDSDHFAQLNVRLGVLSLSMVNVSPALTRSTPPPSICQHSFFTLQTTSNRQSERERKKGSLLEASFRFQHLLLWPVPKIECSVLDFSVEHNLIAAYMNKCFCLYLFIKVCMLQVLDAQPTEFIFSNIQPDLRALLISNSQTFLVKLRCEITWCMFKNSVFIKKKKKNLCSIWRQ